MVSCFSAMVSCFSAMVSCFAGCLHASITFSETRSIAKFKSLAASSPPLRPVPDFTADRSICWINPRTSA
eukprot:9698808-Lingulodinium_polyedra.AAC.1